MNEVRNDLRNIAIIAHVDHGKTTLVDQLLRQSGIFRENEAVADRVLDSNALERERGITILAKNTSIVYRGVRINIVDTPGHADFGGEVERTLQMVDGVLLLVDAFEGPMPQTRFVLKKALEHNLKSIVVINKVDRQGAKPEAVVDQVLDLFIDLGADENQLDFPVLYTSATLGTATADLHQPGKDMRPLLDAIVAHIPAPQGDAQAPAQLLVSNLEYSPYLGRMGVGRLVRGTLRVGQEVAVVGLEEAPRQGRIVKLFDYLGLEKEEIEEARVGEIVCVAGLTDVNLGETITDVATPQALPAPQIEEPTLEMTFLVNDSPFAGQEGTYVTSRQLRERLYRESEQNPALRILDTVSPDAWLVRARGELQLSVLIETMCREGYELQVSRPKVLFKQRDGQRLEPFEELIIEVPDAFIGNVVELCGSRKAEMRDMQALGDGHTRLVFGIPSRGLLGLRTLLLSETRGLGVMHHVVEGYAPVRGEIQSRRRGVLIAWETGEATAYGIEQVEDRGTFFIRPGTRVYGGMIVGEANREDDIPVNVCKKKHMTNMRSSTQDELVHLKSPREMSLDQCLEFIADDELVEATPKSVRMRKKILDHNQRLRELSRQKHQPVTEGQR